MAMKECLGSVVLERAQNKLFVGGWVGLILFVFCLTSEHFKVHF